MGCGGENAGEDEFRPKINFLIKVWSDPNFRPFDNIKSSVYYLRSNLDTDFLIRLSTSQPLESPSPSDVRWVAQTLFTPVITSTRMKTSSILTVKNTLPSRHSVLGSVPIVFSLAQPAQLAMFVHQTATERFVIFCMQKKGIGV